MYQRTTYLRDISPFINKPVIKVITGMRRVGKSAFLEQVQTLLHQKKIAKKDIITINKESLEFDFIAHYKDLNNYVKSKKRQHKKTYLFIDEIQEIEQWEKAITSLFRDGSYDIYITGSNAHLLSSELATLLSGRYIEFPIYPLSFQEFIDFMPLKGSIDEQFELYLQYGGLPAIRHFITEKRDVYQYLNSIYDTILLKDIVQRFNIRNVTTLQNIARFIFDNIGNIFTAKKISDYLKSQKVSLTVDTVQNYTRYLMDTFLIHHVSRFDIKGKRQMEIHEKYYLNDTGIRHALMGYNAMDIAQLLENVIYLELRRKGFACHIGKIHTQEIDFIATKGEQKYYIQVSYLLTSNDTLKREISGFQNIPDHHPKILLTMDKVRAQQHIEGIKHLNIVDFLRGKVHLPGEDI